MPGKKPLAVGAIVTNAVLTSACTYYEKEPEFGRLVENFVMHPEVDMNIEAESGHKVRFIGESDSQVKWGGNDDPRNCLKEGEIYTVDHTEIHSWHTKVYLQEVGGRFPSAAFEDA